MATPQEPDRPAAVAPPGAGFAGDPDFMLSLARGLAVLRAFADSRSHLTIAQVSQRTGLARAVARRCLYTLRQLGYVGEDERWFFLRPQVLSLGHAYLSSTPLAVLAQPFLDEVGRTVHQSCSVATLDGDDIVYVCRSAVTRVMSINLVVGTRLPAYCTSMGQVLLAHLPEAELADYLARVRLVARTSRTLTTVPRLRKALAQARARGYALLDEELEVGLCSVAVPLRDARGRVVAAMNIGAPSSQTSPAAMESRFVPVLQRAADRLAQVLLA
jgi:IclR family transcriptional regulator, pca regulon regulatory protein